MKLFSFGCPSSRTVKHPICVKGIRVSKYIHQKHPHMEEKANAHMTQEIIKEASQSKIN